MKPRYLWRPIAIAFVSVLAFVLGFAFHMFQFFPYNELRHVAAAVLGREQPTQAPSVADPDRGGVLNRQYVLDREHLSLEKDVDTVLLPLRLEGLRISEEYEFPKGAGAITALGNSVVILDRLGNLYASRSGGRAVEKLPFPPLPNHIKEYIASPKFAGLDDRRFRAHRVLFIPSLHSLAVSHAYFDEKVNQTRLAVSLISVEEISLEPVGTWKTVFLSDPERYGSYEGSGGALASRGENTLYVSHGDQYIDALPHPLAQDPKSTLGKIIEIDLQSGQNHIVSLGHRNPVALTILEDGHMSSVEQGPYGGDELNEIQEGSNYGWPNVTLGTGYGTYKWNTESPAGSHVGYTQPTFAWLPAVAVSGMLQIKRFDALWNGDLLVSSLKAQSLFRLRVVGGFVQYSEAIFVGQRIRDLTELEDGTIALLTDDAQLLFLSVDREKLRSGVRYQGHDDDVLASQCLYCHHFGPTSASDFAPTLSGLFQRRIASDNFRYSAGLRNVDGVWSEEKLRAFLADPGKFAPGTSMPSRNLSDEQLDELVEALKTASPVQ